MISPSKNHKTHAATRIKEIDGLLNRGVFMHGSLSNAGGHRIYDSRFVDYVRHEGTSEAYEKSRFIV